MNKYIIIPASEMSKISQAQLDELKLEPRYNVDGSEAILHIEHYEALFPQPVALSLEEEPTGPVYPFLVYESPSEELSALLSSSTWSAEKIE